MVHDAATAQKLYSAEKNVALVRVAVIVLNSLVYLFVMAKEGTIPWLAYTIIVVANIYAFYVVAYEPYRRYPLLLESYFTSTTDAALITLWILATGGFESPFYVLWYVSIAAIAFRYDPRQTMVISAAYAVCYTALLAALGELPTNPTESIVRNAYIFFVGGLGAMLSQESIEQARGRVEMQELMQEARTAEEKFRGVLEAAPNAIVIVDEDDEVVLVNSMAERIFGYDRGDLVGRHAADLLGEGSGRRFEEHLSEIWDHGEARTIVADELAAVRRDGTTFPVEVGLSPLETEEGRLITCVFHDITDRKRAEEERMKRREQLVELERLKDVDEFKTLFINTAAHELGTPLTPIKVQLHILENQKERLDDKQAKAVEVLKRNFERLSGLVDDVLEVARIQADRLGIERERVDLNRIVFDAVETFEGSAHEADITLETRLAPNLHASVDAKRITQVVFNLLSNAIKFTPEGGTITVETARGDEVAIVRVRDTGPGMTEEQMDRLFKPFSQVHDPMQMTGKGSGLGLYISHGIVELHGGRIWVESAGPGQGSTFGFAIPLEQSVPGGVPEDLLPKSARASHDMAPPKRDQV